MKGYLFSTLLLISVTGFAQDELYVPRNIEEAYINKTRNKSGKPGENYWQNETTYDIKVNFDPSTRLLHGAVDIVYINNSPDSLAYLMLKLYPNLFKKGVSREVMIDEEDIDAGVEVESISVDGQLYDLDQLTVKGVNAKLPIDKLAQGEKINVSIVYSCRLAKTSPSSRTGQVDESTFFVAYFYPRIAVYDDIDGWDKSVFGGSVEVYNDFADFRLSVTVPNEFVVWATGDLINGKEVFTKKIIKRLEEAEHSNQEINVIRPEDIESKKVTLNKLTNTFIFEAENITEVAFGTSDHYIWNATSLIVDSSSNRRTRIDAVYHPSTKDFNDVLRFSRSTVEYMSYYYPKWPYPYPHETVFQGLAEMEFPMMVNDHPSSDSVYTAQLTIHEIFHTMFPFYMGINQQKYAWMDEGWATVGEWLLYAKMYPGEVDAWGVDTYEKFAGSEVDPPVMAITSNLPLRGGHINSYFKPGLGYLYAQDILGDEKFFKGLHEYINNWNGKHPIPLDFFNSMNSGSGENLNWFWKAWFYEVGFPDLAIDHVAKNENTTSVTVKAIGSKPVPIHLVVKYADGTDEIVHKSSMVWKEGNRETEVVINSSKKVEKLSLEGTHIPDVDKTNNSWSADK
ncbi:M1 family metallopeptidase [Reichenbachiella sp.]|uniref:M1 family metallopeptidase n=1 Tax=Reichenbachiella sp. TaxID=2184521 RepID=UPI003BB07C12